MLKVILKQITNYFSSFILCSSGNLPAVSLVDTAPDGCSKEASGNNKPNIHRYKHAGVSHQQQRHGLFVRFYWSFQPRYSGSYFRRVVTNLARMATETAKAAQGLKPGKHAHLYCQVWCPGTETNHKAL